MDEDEKIDEEKQRAQVDYVIVGGVTGILAFGFNGEFYMLEEDEMEHGLRIIVDRTAGRVPVYFGIGAINAKKCCRLAKMAVANGTAAVSVLQPMFLKPTHDELFLHFKTIAGSIPDTPVLLYNNPGRVGYTLTTPLVDELAHTNIEGSENPKRWQDVMQILDAGISVISAVNIQHIEGLNEVVEEITGIEIRERVPDSVLAMADEVVNIDLTADELIERLKAGKIYRPDKIAAALGNFFTQDNLLQLRELALKEVALRVEKKVDSEVTGSETFRRDKLLAVIDSSEKRARRVIRKTARMATHLNAAFTVLYVQGDREADDRIPLARQRYLINNLNLATELGGEVRRIRSNSPVESIAGVCREQKINIVCIGRPEFSLFSLLKSAIRLRRLTVRLSRMNIDLFIFS